MKAFELHEKPMANTSIRQLVFLHAKKKMINSWMNANVILKIFNPSNANNRKTIRVHTSVLIVTSSPNLSVVIQILNQSKISAIIDAVKNIVLVSINVSFFLCAKHRSLLHNTIIYLLFNVHFYCILIMALFMMKSIKNV